MVLNAINDEWKIAKCVEKGTEIVVHLEYRVGGGTLGQYCCRGGTEALEKPGILCNAAR